MNRGALKRLAQCLIPPADRRHGVSSVGRRLHAELPIWLAVSYDDPKRRLLDMGVGKNHRVLRRRVEPYQWVAAGEWRETAWLHDEGE